MNPQKPKTTISLRGSAAIDALMVGVRETAEAVASTLGPRGLNYLIEEPWGEPTILHDGVRVSTFFNPEDPFARAGTKIIQEAAKKQRDIVGDGTTVASILTLAILEECLKISAAGTNAMTLRTGLESGMKKVVERLRALSQPVKTLEEKIQIATISAEDPVLGKMIAETIHKIGDHGVLTVEESKAQDTYIDHQQGMQFDKGYAHVFMITDAERRLAILEDAHVLVTDLSLTELAPIAQFLEKTVMPQTKKVFFVSPDIGGDFLSAMVGAKMQGAFLGIGMRAPGVGYQQTEILQDICALTGSTFISKEAGFKLEDATFDMLGRADRIVASKISTIITARPKRRDDVLSRITTINAHLKDPDISDYEREALRARLGKLTNGVAVIRVAGGTEIEMKNRKEAAIDAIASCQSACIHGMVPGGEVIYLSCLSELDENIIGERILKNALTMPFKRLVINAGYDGGEILARRDVSLGFDVTDGRFKNMIRAGIIDSALVPITAIQTAVSVATQLSSLGGAGVYKNEREV